MNVRKSTDYSALYAALDILVAAAPPQMELYREIGRLVSGRPEKGAAVAVAEYLRDAYPDIPGFSPRNLRRMRDFYRAYADTPEVMEEAMAVGWTQNVIILEAELTIQERIWYIGAVRRFGWSKAELQRQIDAGAHEENALDRGDETCYTEDTSGSVEDVGEGNRIWKTGSGQTRCRLIRDDWQPYLFPSPQKAGWGRDRLHRQNGPPDYVYRLHRFGYDPLHRHAGPLGRRHERPVPGLCQGIEDRRDDPTHRHGPTTLPRSQAFTTALKIFARLNANTCLIKDKDRSLLDPERNLNEQPFEYGTLALPPPACRKPGGLAPLGAGGF